MLRTILIHLSGDASDVARLAAAAHLARPSGATMTALFVRPPADMPTAVLGRGASAVYLEEADKAADAAAAASRAHLDGLHVVWDSERGDVREILTRRGRTTDLLVVGRNDAELALGIGGPALVVPQGSAPQSVGTRVLIAWDGSAQAARAVRDGMPLLRSAQSVTAAAIGPKETTGNLLNALLPWLERHEVDAVPHAEEGHAGAALLRIAHDAWSDLLVMGAYGRPPWGEALFGGVTRRVLERTTIPVLLAH